VFIQSTANPKIYIIKNGVLQSGYSIGTSYWGDGDYSAHKSFKSDTCGASWSLSNGCLTINSKTQSNRSGNRDEGYYWWHWYSVVVIPISSSISSVYIDVTSLGPNGGNSLWINHYALPLAGYIDGTMFYHGTYVTTCPSTVTATIVNGQHILVFNGIGAQISNIWYA